MDLLSHPALIEATRLIHAGRLMDATALLQRMLNGGTASDAPRPRLLRQRPIFGVRPTESTSSPRRSIPWTPRPPQRPGPVRGHAAEASNDHPHRNVFMLSNQQLTPISSRCRLVSNRGRDTSRAASREAGLIASSGTLLA